MIKLTLKERNIIYEKVYLKFLSVKPEFQTNTCRRLAIEHIEKTRCSESFQLYIVNSNDYFKIHFPEWYNKKPQNKSVDFDHSWWEEGDINRLLALKECIIETKEPIK